LFADLAGGSAASQESLGSYPLVSRDKTFRPFHGALTSFLHTFVHHVSLSDALYCGSNKRTEPSALMAVLQAWLFTLSHSPLRSFRHTGTVIALDVMTGLVEALKDVNEELSVVSRQKESERKKAGASSREGKDRIKELDRTMKTVHWKKGKLEEYLQEFFNTCVAPSLPPLRPVL
jgi:cohesin complex subunit SA-1/2